MTTIIRATLIFTAALTLIGCSALNPHPYVRIGATQAEIHQGIENGKAGFNLHPGKDQDPIFRVSAGFEKGACNRIKYVSVDKRKISDHAVSVILSLNSRGVAWIVQEFPLTKGKVYYRSLDGRYRAVLTDRTELLVFTEALFRKTMSQNDPATQRPKTVTAPPYPPEGTSQPIATEPNSHSQHIQRIVDDAVSSAKKALHPKGISVVVAVPKTGRIVATSGDVAGWMFEPGSIFKPMVAASALEKGKITPSTRVFCENGLFFIQGKAIKDHFKSGDLTFAEILSKSSNIGSCKMAALLEDQDYYSAIRRFGFGKKTGISLPGEIPGSVPPPENWDELTKMRTSFGQSIAVTPVQLAMAYCALCNGGKLMRPVIGGEKPALSRRVCSEKTASMVKNALCTTGSDQGNATLPPMEGVTVGGKTGTSQSISTKGRYLADRYRTMCVGFFPVKDPDYVIVVAVDEADLPPEKNYGGLVAAPIFSSIASKIAVLP